MVSNVYVEVTPKTLFIEILVVDCGDPGDPYGGYRHIATDTKYESILANEIRDISALTWVFCDSRVLERKLASASRPKFSTCGYLRLRLARALTTEAWSNGPASSRKWTQGELV